MEARNEIAVAPGDARLGALVRLRVFARSLWLQAAWNPRGMQNLGFAYALLPGLRALYPEPEKLKVATERHLAFFNSHPYTAAAIVGGALWHEERIARGEEKPETVTAFKSSLMGPLAALGDGFFWLSLRPALGALCALVALLAGFWGVVLFLVGYNAVHLALRARFFAAGYRLGDGVVGALAAARLTSYTAKLRWLATASAGAAVVAGAGAVGSAAWRPLVLTLGVGAACWALLGRGLSPYALALASVALAGVVGLWM